MIQLEDISMKKDINKLMRLEEINEVLPKNSKVFNKHKKKIEMLCKSLTYPIEDYSPEMTCNSVKSFLKEKETIGRILYSELSNIIFDLDDNKRGLFGMNVEKLLLFVTNKDNKIDKDSKVEEDCRKIVIKIYDHFNLAQKQIAIIDKRFNSRLEITKEHFNDDLKKIEREYITILGIFASVVLTFVGGMAFSTSVLENIAKANIYRTLAVTVLLGMVLVNSIYILLRFIFAINEKPFKKDIVNIKNINMILIGFLCFVVIGWVIDVGLLQGYLRSMFDFWIRQLIK